MWKRLSKSAASLPLLLFALAGGMVSAQSAPPPAEVAEAAATAPLQPDPLLHRGQLDNGLSFIIRPTKEPAGQASIRLFINTGSLDESEETRGISHFIEHMVFNGSRHFERGELIPAMQRFGLALGGSVNAFTSMTNTLYKLDLPNLKPETVEFALTLLRDVADGATLKNEDIERERGIILSELRAGDSATYRAEMAMMEQLVGGTRVVDYQPIGREEVILHCPAETIRAYYRDNYVPSRMTLVITGDVAPQQAEEWVRRHFSSMEKRSSPERPAVGTPANRGAGSFVIPNEEAANTTLILAVVNPWKARPDTLEQRVEALPLDFACAMLNNRLTNLAQQAGCPFISARIIPRERVFGAAEIFSLRVVTPPSQWKEGLVAAVDELRRALQYGFAPEEVQGAAVSLLARSRKALETWERVSAQALAHKIVGTLESQTLFTTPEEDARARVMGMQRIFSRKELCREALERAYDAGRARLILHGKLAEDATPEMLAGSYASACLRELSAPAQMMLRPFAYEYIGEPGTVVSREEIAELGITTLCLSNGVRVNLKPMGRGMGRIYVSAAVDGGTMRLPLIPALDEMAQTVMSHGGLEVHSARDLARLFAGHRVQSSFSMDEERFIFSGNTSPADLEWQCKLLCAAIMHPGYRPEGEAQLRRSVPIFLRGTESSPLGAFGAQVTPSCFGDDCRFCFPSVEQFAAVNTAMVKEVITPFLQKGALELTLVGDFAVDEVLPLLLRSFGAMPPRAAEYSPLPEGARRVQLQPWGKREVLYYDGSLDKTLVALVYPAGDGRDLRRSRRLAILCSIASNRIFDVVRTELGEGYAPTMQVDLRQGYEGAATFAALSTGVEANREKVAAAMERALATLGRGEIGEQEFRLAMSPYLAETDKAYLQPGFWLGSMLRLQSDPRALEMLRSFRSDAASITLEEIRALAREIFGSGQQNTYFILPRGRSTATEAP